MIIIKQEKIVLFKLKKRMVMKKYILLTVLMVITISISAQNRLTVQVDGLDAGKGNLMVALFNSEATFLGTNADGKMVPVISNSVNVVYDNLLNGEYAVALYQDANSNGKLDLNEETYIPIEKYGFSNNVDPAVIKGMPKFEACKFTLEGDRIISISAVKAIK